MTLEELYRYDVNGYILVKGAIAPAELQRLNHVLDTWEEQATADFRAKSAGANAEVRYDDIVNQEPSLVELTENPTVLPYLVEMIEKPRLKSTWIAFKWRGGETKLH